jgi:hypothetical protein
MLDALKSDDERLAPTAANAVWWLLDYGIDLGPDIRRVLIEHRKRFPDNASLIQSALRALDAPKHVDQASMPPGAPDAD